MLLFRREIAILCAVLCMLALASCAISAGHGVTIGEKKIVEAAQPDVQWKSWDQAKRAMENNQRGVLLYIVKPNASETDAANAPKFDPAMFEIDDVKKVCALVTCVKMQEGSPDSVFSTRQGVVLLTFAGEMSSRFEETPAKDPFLAAVRKAAESSLSVHHKKIEAIHRH